MLTPRGIDYLQAQRAAAWAIEDELRATLGEAGFAGLHALLDALGALGDGETARMRTYLRSSAGS